ncbi:MAG: hypothetical protein HYW27_00650 [Candidatus Aenigmarchaeota archaeon]|nr:hypothetical protein [Candidatus Aenigmarchaeota archaeon]
MNPKYLVMFILLSAVVFSGGCTSQKSALPYSKYLAYENPSYGISMNYPSDWNVNEEAESIVVAFMSPSEDKNDRYRENVNVVMNDLSGQDMNLETYSSLATYGKWDIREACVHAGICNKE